MKQSVSDLDEICRRAGMEGDDPLRLALVAVMEAAETARETCAGARGLTPAGEEKLIQSVRSGVMVAIRVDVRALVRQAAWDLVVKAAAAGGFLMVAGWALGRFA